MIVGEAAVTDPAAITHLMCWKPPQDLLRYPNLRVVISAGAGVDQMPKLPEGVDLVRAIDPGIEEMVRDWVVMATLMLHRTMPVYLAQAQQGLWKAQAGKHAKDTPRRDHGHGPDWHAGGANAGQHGVQDQRLVAFGPCGGGRSGLWSATDGCVSGAKRHSGVSVAADA